jgi:hypothetical protein
MTDSVLSTNYHPKKPHYKITDNKENNARPSLCGEKKLSRYEYFVSFVKIDGFNWFWGRGHRGIW